MPARLVVRAGVADVRLAGRVVAARLVARAVAGVRIHHHVATDTVHNVIHRQVHRADIQHSVIREVRLGARAVIMRTAAIKSVRATNTNAAMVFRADKSNKPIPITTAHRVIMYSIITVDMATV